MESIRNKKKKLASDLVFVYRPLKNASKIILHIDYVAAESVGIDR